MVGRTSRVQRSALFSRPETAGVYGTVYARPLSLCPRKNVHFNLKKKNGLFYALRASPGETEQLNELIFYLPRYGTFLTTG